MSALIDVVPESNQNWDRISIVFLKKILQEKENEPSCKGKRYKENTPFKYDSHKPAYALIFQSLTIIIFHLEYVGLSKLWFSWTLPPLEIRMDALALWSWLRLPTYLLLRPQRSEVPHLSLHERIRYLLKSRSLHPSSYSQNLQIRDWKESASRQLTNFWSHHSCRKSTPTANSFGSLRHCDPCYADLQSQRHSKSLWIPLQEVRNFHFDSWSRGVDSTWS